MKRFFIHLGLLVFLGVLIIGCREPETQTTVPEKTATKKPIPEPSKQPPNAKKPIWPADLERSLSDLQALWKNEASLGPFFLEGEKVKAKLTAQLPGLLAEMRTDSSLAALREEMKPFPWWHLQADPEGEKPVIFWDYGYLLEHARDTADRAFLQLCVDWFPADSIEYFQPSWQLPLEDSLVFSMLGSGAHRYSLGRIREQLSMGSPYAPALSRMQRALINDILRGSNYWYGSEAIISEIDSILQQEVRFFPRPAYDSLSLRIKALRAADSPGLRVNRRAGG